MPLENIVVQGAREHNLKNVSVTIPRNKLVVMTGVSGSGKSSLAFDTIYAEGQRRYVESLSAYARQFLGRMNKPDVDNIEGLSPAISIDQKGVSHNPSLDGRHRDRDIRPPPPAVRESRAPALLQLRPPGPEADRAADRGRHSCPGRRAPEFRSWRRWSGVGRASTRRSSRTRGRPGTCASASTASYTIFPRPSTWTRRSGTRSRSWWTGWW